MRVIWPTPILSNTSLWLSFLGWRLTQMCTLSLRILERFCLFDLGCSCKDLLINNYKAHDNSKCPTNISHTSNLYFEILLGAFNNYLLRSTHSPTFCSLDIQLFRQIPPSEHHSNHPFSSVSQVPCNHLCFPPAYLSVPHQKSSLNTNKNQYFRFYC